VNFGIYILGVRSNFRGGSLLDQLLSLDLKPQIVWGPEVNVDFELISKLTNQKYSKFTIKRDIKPQEVACCEGHIRMYRVFLDSKKEWGLFFEDDAIVVSDPTPLLEKLSPITSPVQIFIHDGPGTNLRVPFKEHEGISESDFWQKLDPQYGAYGYILNRMAVKEILKSKITSYINTPDWPYLWPSEITFYHSKKIYISHPADGSKSIIGERINAEATLANLLPNPIRVVQGIGIGLSLSEVIKREITRKLYRILLQISRKVRK
jgi:GR25 family glycosyltransferase involved in LPS biosynthesis